MATTGSPQETAYLNNVLASAAHSGVTTMGDMMSRRPLERASLESATLRRYLYSYMSIPRGRDLTKEEKIEIARSAAYVLPSERNEYIYAAMHDYPKDAEYMSKFIIAPSQTVRLASKMPHPAVIGDTAVSRPSTPPKKTKKFDNLGITTSTSSSEVELAPELFGRNQMIYSGHITESSGQHKMEKKASPLSLGRSTMSEMSYGLGGSKHPPGAAREAGMNEASPRVQAASNAALERQNRLHSAMAPPPYLYVPWNTGPRTRGEMSSGESGYAPYPPTRHRVRLMTTTAISARIAANRNKIEESNKSNFVSSPEMQRLQNELKAVEQSAKYREKGWDYGETKRGKRKTVKKRRLAEGKDLDKVAKKRKA